MRALHVFPHFSVDRTNGASHYQYSLTRALQARGVRVHVFATRTERFVGHAAFGLEWPPELPAGACEIDGVPVTRFAVSYSPSVRAGRAMSLAILRRWEQEQGAGSLGERASPEDVIRSLHSRAITRPHRYDWFAALGRGPNSAGLLRAIVTQRAHYDVLLVGYAPFALIGQVTMAARLARRPVVLLPLFHANDPYHHFRSVYRSIERADRVLAQTAYGVDLFRRLFPRARPVEIGAGVDPAAFASKDVSGERFRQHHGLEKKRPIVLMVGRKEPGKCWDLAVEAIDRVPGNAVLVLIGRDIDCRPIASDRVLHLGEVEDQELRDAYDACDVLVHPSENESFGMILLEAWMRAKPVIGSRRCGPVASLIREGIDGELCDGADDLARLIAGILACPQRAARLGAAGRERVVRRYSWNEIARRVEMVYSEVLGALKPS